jgi:hypothetical protein
VPGRPAEDQSRCHHDRQANCHIHNPPSLSELVVHCARLSLSSRAPANTPFIASPYLLSMVEPFQAFSWRMRGGKTEPASSNAERILIFFLEVGPVALSVLFFYRAGFGIQGHAANA